MEQGEGVATSPFVIARAAEASARVVHFYASPLPTTHSRIQRTGVDRGLLHYRARSQRLTHIQASRTVPHTPTAEVSERLGPTNYMQERAMINRSSLTSMLEFSDARDRSSSVMREARSHTHAHERTRKSPLSTTQASVIHRHGYGMLFGAPVSRHQHCAGHFRGKADP